MSTVGIGQEVVERGVGPASVLRGERGGSDGIQVRRGDEPDLGMGQGVAGVPAGDVAGPDDADAEWCHGRRGYVPRSDALSCADATRPDRAPALHRPSAHGGRPAGHAASRRAAGYQAVELAGLPETPPGRAAAAAGRGGAARRGLPRGHRAPARRSDGGRRSAGRSRLPAGDRAVDARGGPADGRRRPSVRAPSSAGSRGRSRNAASGSATTTTPSSSRRSTGRRSGTSCWPSSRPRSTSSWTSTGRRSAAAIPWPRSGRRPTACACST